jgi:transposase
MNATRNLLKKPTGRSLPARVIVLQECADSTSSKTESSATSHQRSSSRRTIRYRRSGSWRTTILREMSAQFAQLYAANGRPPIPPERLLRALLLQIFYSIRSERRLMEQLDSNLPFRWFVGMSADERVWVPTVFTRNRERLLKRATAEDFFGRVLTLAEPHLPDERFTVDGTLIEAWASQKTSGAGTAPMTGMVRTSTRHRARTTRNSRRLIPMRRCIARAATRNRAEIPGAHAGESRLNSRVSRRRMQTIHANRVRCSNWRDFQRRALPGVSVPTRSAPIAHTAG